MTPFNQHISASVYIVTKLKGLCYPNVTTISMHITVSCRVIFVSRLGSLRLLSDIWFIQQYDLHLNNTCNFPFTRHVTRYAEEYKHLRCKQTFRLQQSTGNHMAAETLLSVIRINELHRKHEPVNWSSLYACAQYKSVYYIIFCVICNTHIV
jgi:hypothetical protein